MHLPKIHAGSFVGLVVGSVLAVQVVPSVLPKPVSAQSSPTESQKAVASAAAVFASAPLFAAAEAEAAPDPNAAALPPDGAAPPDMEPAPVIEDVQLTPPAEEQFLSPDQVSDLQPPLDSGTTSTGRLAWPVSGTISSRFGYRGREFHPAIDIAAPYGRTVRAAEAGVVTRAGWYFNYGRVITIQHEGGLETLYAHNSRLLVSEGDRVERGQPIAQVGASGRATGPHLHFEVHQNGRSVNPLTQLP